MGSQNQALRIRTTHEYFKSNLILFTGNKKIIILLDIRKLRKIPIGDMKKNQRDKFKRFESLDFLKICTFLKNGATQVWDTPQDVPSASQGNERVGYDNVRSFSIKLKSASPTSCRSSPEFRERKWLLVSSIIKQTQWLKQNSFGSAMIWAVDLDDFIDTFYNQEKSPQSLPLACRAQVSDSRRMPRVYKCFFSISKDSSNIHPSPLPRETLPISPHCCFPAKRQMVHSFSTLELSYQEFYGLMGNQAHLAGFSRFDKS